VIALFRSIYKTGEGTCVITAGTGLLAGLHANLKVSSDFVSDPAGVFTWEGPYHFKPCSDHFSAHFS
jgi:hypothetical protein